MSLRVLLVEDDRDLRATLRESLEVEGYKVLTAASLQEGMLLLQHAGSTGRHDRPGVDLVVLDLGLPDGDGEALLAALRRRHNTPVLVISARHGEGQKIRLLDGGADDYLVKPFGIGELIARIRVCMRHRGLSMRPSVTRYEEDGLSVDLAARQVVLHGQPVRLTPTEFKLLARLVRSAGQVVTHRQLLGEVWGAEHVEHTHYLRVYMAQLRAKLEANPAEPQRLLTEPGVGYRLTEPST